MSVITLNEYQKKRDFRCTPEPKSSKTTRKKYERAFVIQKHDASHLHYDFRLAIDGVLVSWAVPKGPSTDPREKRLAIRTENHPLEYADFEGVIPEDQYGGGTVIIWDSGKYKNERDADISSCLDEGKIEITLKGKKIFGGYNLIRTGKNKQGKEQWLLMKADDDAADARRNPVSTEPKSVQSGKTIEEIRNEYEQRA